MLPTICPRSLVNLYATTTTQYMNTLYVWAVTKLSDYLLRTGQRRIRLDESLPVLGNTGTSQRLLL